MMIKESERAMEDSEYFSDWRKQIEYYRDQLANLPEQRRTVPIWTPVTKIGRLGRERFEAEGAQQMEIDGVLHYAISWKETPTRTLERQIDDAEQAAEAGDIGTFGLHIAAIVTSLLNAQIPTIQKAQESARQQKVGKKKRPKSWGTLTKIMQELEEATPEGVAERWKAEPEIGCYQLQYNAGDKKPFCIGDESWDMNAIKAALRRLKKRQKR